MTCVSDRQDLGLDTRGARISIAPLSPSEAERLGLLFAAIDPWAHYPYPAPELAAFLSTSEPAAPRLAVFIDQEAAGAIVLRPNWLRGPYLQFLGVLPAYQARGIGAAVLSWIERTSRANGERNLWVAASDFNIGALRFYERRGFTRVAALDGLVSEARTEILLRKRLF